MIKKNMKAIYTNHAEKKLNLLKLSKIKVNKKIIEKIISNPLHKDTVSDYPKIIASGILDKNHIIRIVYKIENDIITVITCYPAQKGRYFI
ncbi:hypothetical protein A2954_04580 [Candidatus Roizmanbacteria bacterium RIFCSPLOWO2_01_FULL_37_12]|uniref:DUF4258 domain-containing protein n=1 Tax=Candidatus Roizmanbacteria bacterium RIFCSPLOWO2_01_FULL_37_12 TaxID=1802056 RepID=A0A1F7IFY1_9BACT|nr:MAG: hypothetical protein A2954_04580 [Candidatus Roizmanbacteria bacterium RIFCSPLOWO2_01_FULL_37_12]